MGSRGTLEGMGDQKPELYFVFMNFDPQYEHLRTDRSKEGMRKLDIYLSNKHDQLLEELLQPDTFKKKSTLVIVDGFSVLMSEQQAVTLRSAEEMRWLRRTKSLISVVKEKNHKIDQSDELMYAMGWVLEPGELCALV